MWSFLTKHLKSSFRCHIGGSRGTIPEPLWILRRIASRVLEALHERTRCSKERIDFAPWGDLAGILRFGLRCSAFGSQGLGARVHSARLKGTSRVLFGCEFLCSTMIDFGTYAETVQTAFGVLAIVF